MSLPLYQRVALKRDLPEHDLKKGDVAVLVDHITHPEGGEQGCLLEVFNALGESIAVVAVPESAVEDLRADEVLAVRPLADAV
jgi:Domain of unknown function (DUF4926)